MPYGFLAIANDGSEGCLELDAETGRIYRIEYGGTLEEYEIERDGVASEYAKRHTVVTLQFVAGSLEEVLERWLDDINFSLTSLLPKEYYELTPEMLDPMFVPPSEIHRSHWHENTSWEDAEPYADFDALTDSADWRWYQTQLSPEE